MRFFGLGYLCIVILHLSGIVRLQAQTNEIERLMKIADTAQGAEKVHTYAELSMSYFTIDPRKGIVYANKALQLADEFGLYEVRSRAYNNMGANYIALASYDSARIVLNKAFEIANDFNDTLQKAHALNRIGIVYEKMPKLDSALYVFHKALNLYKQLGNLERAGVASENIGTIHLHRGEETSALTHLLEAIAFFEAADARNRLPSAYIRLGSIYSEDGNFTEAEKWHLRAIELAAEQENHQYQGIGINALGVMYKNQGRYEEAVEKYLEAVALGEKIRNPFLLSAVYGNLGNAYSRLGEHRNALDYHRQSLDVSKKLNMPLEVAKSQSNMGSAYNSLGDYSNAKEYFEKALPVFIETETWSKLLSAYTGLITANTGLGAYEDVVNYFREYVTIKDSLNRMERNTALDSLKVQFQTEQTLQENLLLSQQNIIKDQTIANQRMALTFAIVGAAMLITLALTIFKSRMKMKQANRKLEEKNKEISRQADELREINNKLNELSEFKDSMSSFLAHDLKNPLNAIINYHPANRAKDGSEIKQIGMNMLNIVSNMLDISRHDNKAIRYEQEHSSLTSIINNAFQEVNYLAISRSIRLKLDFAADIFVHVDQEAVKRVFVNMLTNAIKYSPNGTEIKISAEPADVDFVLIKVVDQGAGIDEEFLPFVFDRFARDPKSNKSISVSSGIGLTYCKMAVELHGGTIGVESSAGNGSSFWFTLPLSTEKLELKAGTPIAGTIDANGFHEIQLSNEEKTILQPVCESLRQISVYQISDVKEQIMALKDESPGIKRWKERVYQVLNQCNEMEYNDLINID